MYCMGINLAKLSALSFYLRVFKTPTTQRATKCVMALVGTWTVFAVLYCLLSCFPLRKFWTVQGAAECPDRTTTVYLPAVVFSIVTDLVILAIPVPKIWSLKTDRGNKIGLTCLFAIGLSYVFPDSSYSPSSSSVSSPPLFSPSPHPHIPPLASSLLNQPIQTPKLTSPPSPPANPASP
jgi:hypothetical protein